MTFGGKFLESIEGNALDDLLTVAAQMQRANEAVAKLESIDARLARIERHLASTLDMGVLTISSIEPSA